MLRRHRTFPIRDSAMARSKTTPLNDAIESFLLARHDLSEKTKADYRKDLFAYVRWLGTGVLSDLSKPNVDRYLAEKAKAGSKRPTPFAARLAAATLKSFATWLSNEGIWADPDGSSVLSTVKIPKVPEQGRPPFDDPELATIVRVAGTGPNGARDRAIITTM